MKQYKSNLANETVARAFGDLNQFAREWHVCMAARGHLLQADRIPDGVPQGR